MPFSVLFLLENGRERCCWSFAVPQELRTGVGGIANPGLSERQVAPGAWEAPWGRDEKMYFLGGVLLRADTPARCCHLQSRERVPFWSHFPR